jgi:hypothetical protein
MRLAQTLEEYGARTLRTLLVTALQGIVTTQCTLALITHATRMTLGTVTRRTVVMVLMLTGASTRHSTIMVTLLDGARRMTVLYAIQITFGIATTMRNVTLRGATGVGAGANLINARNALPPSLGIVTQKRIATMHWVTGAEALRLAGVTCISVLPARLHSLGIAIPKRTATLPAVIGATRGARNRATLVP